MDILIVVLTVLNILILMFNVVLIPALHEHFVRALEKDVTRILKEKGIL
jgi:hypothetical protein